MKKAGGGSVNEASRLAVNKYMAHNCQAMYNHEGGGSCKKIALKDSNVFKVMLGMFLFLGLDVILLLLGFTPGFHFSF